MTNEQVEALAEKAAKDVARAIHESNKAYATWLKEELKKGKPVIHEHYIGVARFFCIILPNGEFYKVRRKGFKGYYWDVWMTQRRRVAARRQFKLAASPAQAPGLSNTEGTADQSDSTTTNTQTTLPPIITKSPFKEPPVPQTVNVEEEG